MWQDKGPKPNPVSDIADGEHAKPSANWKNTVVGPRLNESHAAVLSRLSKNAISPVTLICFSLHSCTELYLSLSYLFSLPAN